MLQLNETCLLTVDKISFASIKQIETLNKYLNWFLCDKPSYNLYAGNLPIVFVGDFNQLKPMGGDSSFVKKRSIFGEKNQHISLT